MPNADLILQNANVITVDPRHPTAELVACKGDRILLVGDRTDLGLVAGTNSRIIDCRGKILVPGFNDAHCHILSFVRKLLSVDLSPAAVKSIGDIKAAVGRKVQQTPPGQWISGAGYHEFYLAEKRHPTRRDIDEVAPNHPVVLSHRSLHACVLNSLAMSLAGINRETPEPPGGLIERDLESGEPTGLLFEMLGHIREKVIPPLSEAQLSEGIALANRQYISNGITSLQEATVVNGFSQWQKFRYFMDTGQLKSRIYMMSGAGALSELREAGLTFGAGDNQLRLGGIKIILSEAAGRLYPPQAELNRQVLEAYQAGFPLAIHAIQPGTVEAAISALEYLQSQLPQTGRRHRIEHCSECPPHLLTRLKRLPVMVVSQPPFLYYSGERYLAMLTADELRWIYRLKSFLVSGLTVAGSSDSPIVPHNPLIGIYAAVTRKAESGQELLPEERISGTEALAMYTIGGAQASYEENSKGSLTPGKLADMVLLSDDPTKMSPERLKDIKVEMTIIGGKVVWEV